MSICLILSLLLSKYNLFKFGKLNKLDCIKFNWLLFKCNSSNILKLLNIPGSIVTK
jgi:hypothetical protein